MRLIALMLLCSLTASAQDRDAACGTDGICWIKEPVLREILKNQQYLINHVAELRQLCGWERK